MNSSYAVLKSASFHGSEGMMEAQRNRRRTVTKPGPSVPAGQRPPTLGAAAAPAPHANVEVGGGRDSVSPVSDYAYAPAGASSAGPARSHYADPVSLTAHRPSSQNDDAYVTARHRYEVDSSYQKVL